MARKHVSGWNHQAEITTLHQSAWDRSCFTTFVISPTQLNVFVHRFLEHCWPNSRLHRPPVTLFKYKNNVWEGLETNFAAEESKV